MIKQVLNAAKSLMTPMAIIGLVVAIAIGRPALCKALEIFISGAEWLKGFLA